MVDSILGCVVGGAIGDALGSFFEGRSGNAPDQIWGQEDWRLSDDTQLTLATCEAIATTGVPDPAAIAAAFLRWFRGRRLTGLGASTLKALRDLDAGAHWALAGRRGERAAGNGAAMRIAPLAFCLDPEQTASRQLIRDVCRITHHSDEAYVGALAVVLVIREFVSGARQWNNALLGQIADALPDTSVRDRLHAYADLPQTVTLAEAAERFGVSGYVVESVPFAIAAAQRVGELGFAPMLEHIIRAGGDADTNASLAGQMAGAALGLSGLPANLVDRLPQPDFILTTARRFAGAVTGTSEDRPPEA
jgi:ADP-ribosylglycohydrolase